MLPPQNLPVLPDTSSSSKVSSEIATAAFNCEKGSVIIIIYIWGFFPRDLTTITIFTDSHICTREKTKHHEHSTYWFDKYDSVVKVSIAVLIVS